MAHLNLLSHVFTHLVAQLKEFKEVPLAVSPTALSVPLSVAANSPGVRRTRAGSVGASSPRALSLSLEIPDFSDDEGALLFAV